MYIIVNVILVTCMPDTNVLKKKLQNCHNIVANIFTKVADNFFRTYSVERRTKQNSRSLVPHLISLYYPDRVVLFRLLKHIHCRSSRSTSRRNYTATHIMFVHASKER